MNIDKNDFCLRRKFLEYFAENLIMEVGCMYLKLYNPSKDKIVNKYENDDWRKIFNDTTEEDLKDLSTCSNVIILIWCDISLNYSHGMIYFEENINNPCNVIFHGGTWDHDPKYYREIFRSLIFLFDFILAFKTVISTTCGINNIRADKLQHRLCFEETKRDDYCVYKTLNKQLFKNSIFIERFRTAK